MEYAATVWSPHTKRDISNLERVQRSAARYVMNDYSYYSSVSAMLDSLKWPTLDKRRNYLKLLTFFKIIQGLAIIPSISLTPLTTSTRGHSCRYRSPSARVDSYLYSFLPTTIKLWNQLPQHLVTSSSLDHFRKQLNYFYFN